MKEVSNKDFEQEVLKSDKPVIVDFWAEWCGPCRIFTPVLEELEKEFGDRIKFVSVNTDENYDIAVRYNIMSIPTAMLFENGVPKAMSVGAIPKEEAKRWIEENL